MIRQWYLDVTVKNDNAQAYSDMLNDMKECNGVFTCTMKLNDGFICDYVVVENSQYAEPGPTKANKVSGQRS